MENTRVKLGKREVCVSFESSTDRSLPKAFYYKNAYSIKLKNRRLTVISQDKEEGGFVVVARVVDGKKDPRSIHRVIKDKIVETTISFTKEAFKGLVMGYLSWESLQKEKNELEGNNKAG